MPSTINAKNPMPTNSTTTATKSYSSQRMDAKIGGHLTPRFDADQKFLTAYTIGKNYSALSPRLAFGDLRAVAREYLFATKVLHCPVSSPCYTNDATAAPRTWVIGAFGLCVLA
jgi:hypothetical protein